MPLPNYDFDIEQQNLQRRQQLLDALQGASLQPIATPTAGGMAAPISPMEGIAKLAQAYVAKKGTADINAKRQELSDRYKNELRTGMESYLNTMQGSQGTALPLDNPDGMGPVQVEGFAKPDPKKAMLDAIASNHPVLQQLGMSQLSQLGKDRLTKKDILSLTGYDPKSKLIAAMAGDESVLQPEVKEHVVNNQIYAGDPTNGYKPVADGRDKFNPVGPIAEGPDGPIYGQTEKSTGKATFAPKGTVVNVNTSQKAGDKFATELAGKRADVLSKSYDNAIAASKALDAIGSAAQDLNAGIKSGSTANISLALAKVGKSLGIENADPSIANTEAFRANMARETLNLVKGLGSGTGISNADREFAEKASGGAITLDDASMLRLMNIAKAAAGNVMLEHTRLLNTNANATGGLPEDIKTFEVPWALPVDDMIDLDTRSGRFAVKAPKPMAAKPASTAPVSLEAYLKSKGH